MILAFFLLLRLNSTQIWTLCWGENFEINAENHQKVPNSVTHEDRLRARKIREKNLKSPHPNERSWVLMSAHSFMAPCLWLLLSSPECSLLHGAKLMIAHGCSWVLNGDQEHSKLLLAAYECSWGLMGAHKCSWLLISSTHEKPWAWHHGAMSTHESSRADMSMVPFGYER